MRKGLISAMMCMALLFAATPSVLAQEVGNSYKETLAKMLDVCGTTSSAKAMLPQMVAMMKQQIPTLPAGFWDGFQQKIESKFNTHLTELYAPIYQKYLTEDDLREIVAFYESPVGKKLATANPSIMVEGLQIGQKLGMEIATELEQELKAQENK